jgi:hypothetical protein
MGMGEGERCGLWLGLANRWGAHTWTPHDGDALAWHHDHAPGYGIDNSIPPRCWPS